MARKSIDFSQSLLKFQGKGSERPDPTVTPPTQNSPSSTPGPASPRQDGARTLDQSLRNKYILQNKSLARNNSAMSRKINDMELRLAELIKENMKLKKGSCNTEMEVKKRLEEKVELIETKMFEKFSDILRFMKDLRWESGLTANPQLDILNDINRPVTSTPIEIDSNVCNPFGILDPLKLSFGDVELERPPQKPQGTQEPNQDSFDSQINQTFLEEGSTDNARIDKFSTIFEDKEPSELSNIAEPDQPIAEKSKSSSPQISTSDWLRKANELIMENELRKSRKASNLDGKKQMSPKKTIQVLRDNEGDNNEKSTCQQQNSASAKLTRAPEDAIKHAKNTNKQIEPILVASSKETSIEAEETKEEQVTRPRRARKKVDYKPVPLRAKMRRDSVKLLDAVGDNVLINYAVNKKPSGDEMEKKRRSDETENEKSVKRKPLGTIKSNARSSLIESKPPSRTKAQSPGIDKENQIDMSVFDFEDEPPRRQSVYVGKKTARRTRRQTMM